MYFKCVEDIINQWSEFGRFDFEDDEEPVAEKIPKQKKRKPKKKGVAETDVDPELLDLSETNRFVHVFLNYTTVPGFIVAIYLYHKYLYAGRQ